MSDPGLIIPPYTAPEAGGTYLKESPPIRKQSKNKHLLLPSIFWPLGIGMGPGTSAKRDRTQGGVDAWQGYIPLGVPVHRRELTEVCAS